MDNNYNVLEYHKIINELINISCLEVTKEAFIDLEIIKERSNLDKEINLMRDMIDFYKFDGGLELLKISDISKYIKTLDMFGSYFTGEDLADIKKNLEIFRVSKNRAKTVKDKYNSIWSLFNNIEDLKDIEKLIGEAVDDNGEIKDDASIGLRDIRKQKSTINANIKEKFDDLMYNKETSRAIQERIITKRNDRYVISVKTDFKGLIKGIEHDRSATGSTVYIEPLNVVSLNNKIKEYEVREKEEIRKILLRFTELIRVRKDDFIQIKKVLERLDFLNAKTIYSIRKRCNVPKIVNKEYLKLVDARHPLIDDEKVVPINFELGDREKIMLITGPNTGGKTVTLKVAGLLTIMTLSGIPIPASEKTEIGHFSNVLSDIGDEQSIEQNLSSFSGHVSKIKEIIELATSKSLVLMDELGSGTDPMEGAAFAMSIIDYLKSKNILSIITTHYSEVKAYAYNTGSIKSASMEFDIETLSPTYKLLEGIPGESNALIIAKKYGIPDEIISNAKNYISEDNQKVEEMLRSIKDKNDELERLNAELKNVKEETEKQKKEYDKKILDLENEKNQVVKEAYDKADNYLKELQAKAKNLINQINSEDAKKEDAKQAQRSLNMLRSSFLEDKKKNVKENKVIIKDINFEIGEEVLIKSLNQNGRILKIIPSSYSVQVQAGILKMVVSINDIEKIIKTKKKNYNRFVSSKSTRVRGEVDLRGKTVDEAIHELEIYLDRAMITGYNEVYVIHGKGTMVLRKEIQEFLKKSKYVKEFRDANQNEGGIGCTVVSLK